MGKRQKCLQNSVSVPAHKLEQNRLLCSICKYILLTRMPKQFFKFSLRIDLPLIIREHSVKDYDWNLFRVVYEKFIIRASFISELTGLSILISRFHKHKHEKIWSYLQELRFKILFVKVFMLCKTVKEILKSTVQSNLNVLK